MQSSKSMSSAGTVAEPCDPSVLEAEAGRSQGTPQPRLHSETLFQNKQNTSIIFHPVTLAYLKALKWYFGLSLANHTFSFQHNVMFPVTGSCYITHDGVELPASYLSLLGVGNMGLSQHTLPSLTLKTLSWAPPKSHSHAVHTHAHTL